MVFKNFSLIFILLFIPSFSLKLPLNSKIITYNGHNEYINSDNNLRSLVQRDLEITNYKYLLMETEICIGTPLQCFKVLYDTGSVYLIVGMLTKNLKFKKGFNTVLSDTYMSSCDTIVPVSYKSSVIMAYEVWDKATIIENYNLPYLFSFL